MDRQAAVNDGCRRAWQESPATPLRARSSTEPLPASTLDSTWLFVDSDLQACGTSRSDRGSISSRSENRRFAPTRRRHWTPPTRRYGALRVPGSPARNVRPGSHVLQVHRCHSQRSPTVIWSPAPIGMQEWAFATRASVCCSRVVRRTGRITAEGRKAFVHRGRLSAFRPGICLGSRGEEFLVLEAVYLCSHPGGCPLALAANSDLCRLPTSSDRACTKLAAHRRTDRVAVGPPALAVRSRIAHRK